MVVVVLEGSRRRSEGRWGDTVLETDKDAREGHLGSFTVGEHTGSSDARPTGRGSEEHKQGVSAIGVKSESGAARCRSRHGRVRCILVLVQCCFDVRCHSIDSPPSSSSPALLRRKTTTEPQTTTLNLRHSSSQRMI